MRERFEAQENDYLAPFAVKSGASQGRRYDEAPSPNRTCFQRDRDRIIHAKAFRRLKHKTQVFIATESDHYRSRMTHTLEVAQISRHLARLLQVNEDLAETIALAHDLGHTPFGHSGERELNRLMKAHGGYEHNLQSRRIVDELESKYPNFPGLNLSFEIREGLIKHATPYDNPQVDDATGFISVEAMVCNLADEIAYNNHDLDDGLRAGILSDQALTENVTLWREAKAAIQAQYSALHEKQQRALINSHLISSQIINVTTQSIAQIKAASLSSLDDVQALGKKSVVCFCDEMFEKNQELRRYLFKHFYQNMDVYRMNQKGQRIIRALFEAFEADPLLLPQQYRQKIQDGTSQTRVICDYVAGMTDTYAQKELSEIQ